VSFSDPQAVVGFLDDGKYVAKLIGFEETPPSAAHPEWGAGMKWRFYLATYPTANAPSTVVKRPDSDEVYEFWQFSGSKLTPRTKAWAWIEALLGRPIVEGQDSGEALAAAVLGKKAVVMIGPLRSKEGVIKPDQVLSMTAYVEPAKATTRAPVSAAVATLEDDLPESQRTGAAEPEEAFAF
jgi:hypothetical protein